MSNSDIGMLEGNHNLGAKNILILIIAARIEFDNGFNLGQIKRETGEPTNDLASSMRRLIIVGYVEKLERNFYIVTEAGYSAANKYVRLVNAADRQGDIQN